MWDFGDDNDFFAEPSSEPQTIPLDHKDNSYDARLF